jgi:hypothetical protein
MSRKNNTKKGGATMSRKNNTKKGGATMNERGEAKRHKKGSVKEMLFLLFLLPTLVAPSLTMAFEAGYSKGFYIKEGKEYSLKARIRGQVQGFLKSEEVNGEREEKGGFLIKRARLVFSGNVFSELLEYELQITLEGKEASLRDLLIEYPLLKEAIILKAGQYKVPFNRETLTSSSNLELVDRSLSNKYFSIGRDIGVSLTGGFLDGSLNYALGVFSGEGKNMEPVDIKPLLALRIVASSENSPEKIWKPSQGAFDKNTFWAIGIGTIYADGVKGKGLKERKDLPQFLKPATTYSSVSFAGVSGDITFKKNPISFEGEVNYMKSSDERDAIGGRAETGFFLTKKVQTALRYSFVKELFGKNEMLQEFTGGLSWFISKHDLKLQTDYSYLTDKKEHLLRAQFQFYL